MGYEMFSFKRAFWGLNTKEVHRLVKDYCEFSMGGDRFLASNANQSEQWKAANGSYYPTQRSYYREAKSEFARSEALLRLGLVGLALMTCVMAGVDPSQSEVGRIAMGGAMVWQAWATMKDMYGLSKS